MIKQPLRFALFRGQQAKFQARGIDLPITAEANTFRELRARVHAQLRDEYALEVPIVLLLGVRRDQCHPPRTTVHNRELVVNPAAQAADDGKP